AVGGGIPVHEGVAGLGHGVGGERLGAATGEVLVGDRARPGVVVEGDHVGVGAPDRVERGGRGEGVAGVVVVAGAGAVGGGIPVHEGVAGVAEAVRGQVGRHVVVGVLVAHRARAAPGVGEVRVKGDAVGVDGPDRVERGGRGEGVVRAVVVAGAGAVGGGIPVHEGVAGLGHGVGGERGRHVVVRALAGDRARTGVVVEGDGVGVDGPDRVEGDAGVEGDARAVVVAGAGAVGGGIPVHEGVAGLGHGVGGERLGAATGEVLVGDRARTGVVVEGDHVGVGAPDRVERGGRGEGVAGVVVVAGAGAVGGGIPVHEGVAGVAEAVRGQVGRHVVVGVLVAHRARAAPGVGEVRVKGDAVGVDGPDRVERGGRGEGVVRAVVVAGAGAVGGGIPVHEGVAGLG